ncbi:MAG: hypothetical protein J6T23_02450 [Elusimicrobia bacterium]|nr:hypothetical protein [Elusimicrobiota bacterium]
MNGGIQPTVELATNNNGNGFYPYPFYPMMMGGGNGGFGGYGSDWIWVILLLALFGGNWGGNNGNGGFFGGNSFDNGFAWLSNGQKEIMSNTNNGFDTLHLSNQLDTVNSGIYSLSNQLCNCCSDMNQTVSNGFYNAEVSACNRQMANMNQNFNNQIATLQGFNGLQSSLDNCCCENRLATQDLKSTVISENCTDREVLREIGQNILVNQTANTQKIIDEIFRDRLDEKNDKIADLQRQLQMADLRASQIAQTAQLRADNVASNEALLNSLNTCPIPSTPVYGRTPIFSCNNNGCGCGFNTTSQFI